MRQTLLILFTVFFFISNAQLSVRNDAFIYVKDQIVFVKDDINLNESNSKIYLRDESQIVQGDGTTGNSGIGELSVYQEGNVNQWSYNYWCSPIGGILTNNTLNNPFQVNQLDDPLLGTASTIDSQNSAFVSSPDGSSNPLTISQRWLYTYVASDSYADWNYVSNSGDIPTGLGFSMKGIGTADTGNQSYDFRGKPNNGLITNTVVAEQFTLVGNPYPSAIDAALYIHDSDNANAIDDTLYFWEQDGSVNSHVLTDYVGGYYEFSINAAGDMITDTPAVFRTYDEQDNTYPLAMPQNGGKTSGRYIPIGQGFMVKGSPTSTGTVSAKNTHRVYEKEGAESSFFRKSNAEDKITENKSTIKYQDNGFTLVPEDYKRFRINIDFTVNESQYTRQLVLNFHDTATAGHDRGLELKRANNFASDAYFKLNETIYSGQAFPFEEDLVIPIIVDIEEQQPLRFRIFDLQNFEESQAIYLHDIANATYVDLRNQDYELNAEPGNYTDRFEIVFAQQAVLNLEDFDITSLTINQNNAIKQLTVLNPDNLDINTIEVFDVTGKRIYKVKHNTIKNTYQIATSNLSDGVYIVNVISKNDVKKTQKIIVKN